VDIALATSQPVVNPNKSEKFRVVFDCAANYGRTSLNDRILQGPDMTNTLLNVLLRFREGAVAVIGDIRATFHEVNFTPHHRDVLQFQWLKDGNVGNSPEVY